MEEIYAKLQSDKDMADGTGEGEGNTHDEPVSKDEQSNEDSGPRHGRGEG